EVGVEGARRDGEDPLAERIRVEAARLAADELVVDRLGWQVHESEVECAVGRADVLRRDRVDVDLHVTRERLLVELPLGVVGGVNYALEVLERELGVDRDEL